MIESEPNRKTKKKANVANYHHFYLPIKVRDKLYTARIVGEELKGPKRIKPIDVKLYDVIIAKKGTSPTATQGDLLVENVPLRITIAEMLRNVKDSNGQPYVNQDGTLAVRKDNDFYQKEGEYTGKKDLIAYHNISQANLDKAIQLGGLAVPSIAVTKKETDFSNFGDITLLMPQDVVNPKETPVYTRDAWTGVFPVCLCRKKFRGLLWITETCILLYFIKMSYNISKHRATLDVSNLFNRAKYVYFR